MGGCLSGSVFVRARAPAPPPPPPTAKVISIQGHLREYPVPISVSRVLHTENSAFLCNSDRLFYDDFIPPLPLHEHLLTDQIYFLLPSSSLHQRLTASDMAALAVKATLALQNASPGPNRKKPGRISPILVLDSEDNNNIISKKNLSDAPIPATSSVKKMQRLTSRRAKMAVRSFKLRLSTIYEGRVV